MRINSKKNNGSEFILLEINIYLNKYNLHIVIWIFNINFVIWILIIALVAAPSKNRNSDIDITILIVKNF